jgi:hypothetical protein
MASSAANYSYEAHIFKTYRVGGKLVCHRCGLTLLRNALTQWSVDKGCNYEDHRDWPRIIRVLT